VTSCLGEEQVVPVVDSGQGWVDTCATVGECTMGRGDRRRGAGQEKGSGTRIRSQDTAKRGRSRTVHTDLHNLSGSTVIFSLHEKSMGSSIHLLKTTYKAFYS
jgi:hypothetical protein